LFFCPFFSHPTFVNQSSCQPPTHLPAFLLFLFFSPSASPFHTAAYAVFIGLTPKQGALILGLANGSGFAGRVLLGLVADRVSNTKTLLFSAWATAFAVMVLWPIAKSFGSLLAMGVTFNIFAGNDAIENSEPRTTFEMIWLKHATDITVVAW
jgi:hypothetical protein